MSNNSNKVLYLVYPYQVSTKYNDNIGLISLYSIKYGLTKDLNMETDVSTNILLVFLITMDIMVAFLIAMDILVIILIVVIPNMVSLELYLFTVTQLVTYNTTAPNWIETTIQPIINGYTIILAIVMIVFTEFSLILHIPLIGFHFKQCIWCCICSNNNNKYTTPPVAPIQAINYGINGCDIALIGIKIKTTGTTANMDRIGEYHDIILDLIVTSNKSN